MATYCTDEDIAIRAAGDFVVVVPRDQVVAAGADGVLSGSSWVLSSASVANFATRGVTPGQMVKLWGAKGTPAGAAFGPESAADLFAVDAVSGATLTLRRKGLASGQGQPPSAIGLTGVGFSVVTLYPQIEDASFEIQQRYGIDDAVVGSATADLYKVRELRQATTLTVLHRLYLAMARDSSKPDDFARKASVLRHELSDVLALVALHWGPTGDDRPASIRYGRVTR